MKTAGPSEFIEVLIKLWCSLFRCEPSGKVVDVSRNYDKGRWTQKPGITIFCEYSQSSKKEVQEIGELNKRHYSSANY